ncbi:uncharacterized protein PV07_12862 [Cladophialophora immunda]|uniref:Uncharacterized protein n=1 Tax=Cladophialophora immunda TaxID=569365 RepID=A0A0D2BTF6_9EURO|nr:uncharacterized protein PV07_12862 [Cladophialophora immunda]KIW21705.1 hypothetical protein PV07_12862 [Cladophialophora immunda]
MAAVLDLAAPSPPQGDRHGAAVDTTRSSNQEIEASGSATGSTLAQIGASKTTRTAAPLGGIAGSLISSTTSVDAALQNRDVWSRTGTTDTLPRHSHQPSELGGEEFCQDCSYSDDELQHYAEFLKSTVRDPSIKADFQRASQVALERRLFLDWMYETQDTGPFLVAELPPGIAWEFCRRGNIETFRRSRRH